MRAFLLVACAVLVPLCFSEKSEKMSDIFEIDVKTCSGKDLDDYRDQTLDLLDSCVKSLGFLMSGKELQCKAHPRVRNLVRNAHFAWGSQDVPKDAPSMTYNSKDMETLKRAHERLLAIQHFWTEGETARPPYDRRWLACDMSTFTKVTLAVLYNNELPTVLTMLGARMLLLFALHVET